MTRCVYGALQMLLTRTFSVLIILTVSLCGNTGFMNVSMLTMQYLVNVGFKGCQPL